ncbi:hypothetical protein UPYG_G00040790 [Umbra pygmaea]|uniref:Uncharacterized protein n=1 Tax=Umbra pygmaea TaxID=75934 RepID=A0ABD0XPZ9_UMBPY
MELEVTWKTVSQQTSPRGKTLNKMKSLVSMAKKVKKPYGSRRKSLQAYSTYIYRLHKDVGPIQSSFTAMPLPREQSLQLGSEAARRSLLNRYGVITRLEIHSAMRSLCYCYSADGE